MSTRMPSRPSSGPRKVASTTYVAPCSRWAGPKTSPSKLWAIITWSRTVTANTASPSSVRPRVGDRVAERRSLPRGELGHQRGQLVERRGPREERVVRRVAQQRQRQRQPLGTGAPVSPVQRHLADLAGAEPQPTRVERAAQVEPD